MDCHPLPELGNFHLSSSLVQPIGLATSSQPFTISVLILAMPEPSVISLSMATMSSTTSTWLLASVLACEQLYDRKSGLNSIIEGVK